MSKIIGIDLGSTNSCVSVYEGSEVVVVNNAEGKRTTPSIVAFTKDGERKVGDPAKRQAVTNPENTIYTIKRLMGKTYDQVKDMVLPYKVVKGDGNRPAVVIGDKHYSPEEISAMILTKMKKAAEEYIGETVTRAVITVPAFFNTEERDATIAAGKIAGLEVERIINEPTSAALAFGSDKTDDAKKIVVFDFGGSTHDVSVLDFGDGVFEVLATSGDLFLGGDDVDMVLINWLADSFLADEGVDIRKDPMALQRVKEASEKAKIELSSSVSTEINLPYIMPVDGIPKHLVKTLTKSTFEKLIDPIVKKTMIPCVEAIKKSGLSIDEINEIIMVGGSTRIPAIKDAVKKYFGKELNNSINPDEAVSIGATVQGGVISGNVQDILLLDVTPISLGIETMGGIFTKLVESNTTIPVEKTQIFSTAENNQNSVEIHALQGERQQASANKSLGRFHVGNIPPAMKGVPQIEIKFSLDANSVLTVSAKELGTGQENSIRIENSSSLSDEEIDKMKQDATLNEEADKKFKEEVDKINEADSLIFSLDNMIKDNGDSLSGTNKDKVDAMIIAIKSAKDSKEYDKLDELKTSSSILLNDLYQEIQNSNNGPESSSQSDTVNETSSSSDDVEFEEVDEDKKS